MPQTEHWTNACPTVATLDRVTQRFLDEHSRAAQAPAGAWLYREGGVCEAYLILVSGRVRVQKTAPNGREIVLYRVGPGETCVVTTACLMCEIDYDAEAIAETDICARVLPRARFKELLASSESFREFVFRTYGVRVSNLLERIEEVAFERIERRLATRLLDYAGGSDDIVATHQDLAVELGTAREVVSRQLKEFERKGLIELRRGGLALRDQAALRILSQGEGSR